MNRLQSFVIPTLLLASIQLNKGCGSRHETQTSPIDAALDLSIATENESAAQPLDLGLVADFASALRQTETRLKLSESDYRPFARLIPGPFATLIDQMLQDAGIRLVTINSAEALMRFDMDAESFAVDLGMDEPLVLSKSMSIVAVERLSPASNGVRIEVSGLSVGSRKIRALVFMQDYSAELSLEDGSSTRTPVLVDSGISSGWSMPTAGQLLSSVFMLAHAITRSDARNQIHIIGRALDQNGLEVRDQNGRTQTNAHSPIRKYFRKLLVEYHTSPEYLYLFDQITEVRIDRNSMKFWLNRPVQLRFTQGSLIMAQSFSLRSSDAATILPVQGISTTAVGADGATLQNLRIRSNRQSTILDAQVYGYRNTILGRVGRTEVISFPFY